MMRIEDVREHLQKVPFEPFRMCFSDAWSVEVVHPELCWLGRTSLYVAVPDPRVRGRALKVLHCALVHIVRFEPTQSTGKTKTRRKYYREHYVLNMSQCESRPDYAERVAYDVQHLLPGVVTTYSQFCREEQLLRGYPNGV